MEEGRNNPHVSGDVDKYFYSLKPVEDVMKSHGTRTAENQCQYMLPTLQRMAEARPNLRLLDAGCGPGSITISLAKYVPSGHIIGIDLSEAVLEKAQQATKDAGVTNVSFQRAGVYELPFQDESFDVIHTHQAVAHFKEHVRAIKELLRVLRPGGILCMREGDLATARFYPDTPLLEECFRSLAVVHEASGGYADAGRQLRKWTLEAGVPRERIKHTAGTWCYATLEQRKEFDGARIFKGSGGEKAVELGVVTKERIRKYEEAWKKWEEDEDAVMMMMHGEVIAMK